MTAQLPPMLLIPHAHARAFRLPWSALLANKGKELWTKATGRRIKGQGMIGADPAIVRDGFGALVGDDFHQYNLPQAWVERRQIPQVLHRRVPREHAAIIDLGCGPGTSTEVIARFASPTWSITGFDLTPHLIASARARAARGGFTNRLGATISPTFHCQDIALPLLRDGTPIPDASIDLALSGGVVGLYMLPPGALALARELRRIVKPGGFVALDAGPSIPARTLRSIVEPAGFAWVDTARSFWIEPRPKLVFVRLAG